ncbi:MAG TPA: GNAT family N-acetyltransferase [Actinopolymorphaceae bacterium]|nr:GNAT family N-acetyltransferase [Actinopolymorphaceae bacterium]
MTDVQPDTLRVRLEQYLDLLPRANAKAEDIGPFTLFVSNGAWPYYARPRLAHTGGFSSTQVRAVWERQQRLRVPVSFEWVHEVSPGLAEAATAAGLVVERRPLLLLDQLAGVPAPSGVSVRFLAADEPDLTRAIAAVDLGFGVPGAEVGAAGPQQRDERAAAMKPDRVAYFRDRIANGLLHWASADDASGPVGGGSYHPRADVAELTGIGTVPSVRRRGIGAAVTAALAAHALAHGVKLAFLSAGSLDAARIYERVGFRHIGTACVAGPPSS